MAERSWTFHDALRLVLLFHDGKPWGAAKQKEWLRITGTTEATTKVMCDHLRWMFGGAAFDHFRGEESASERLWGIKAGHVLSEQDAKDIETIISEHNEEIGEGANAFHLGRLDALREIGGDALIEAVETKDAMQIEISVERAMARVRAQNSALRSS